MQTLADATSALSEFALRDWLRTVPGILNRVSNDTRRIDLDYAGTGTYLIVYRSGGAPYRELPMDQASITLHCYGSTRHAAALLESEVVRALQSLNGTNLNDFVYAYDAEVLSRGNWLPTDGGAARYIVSAVLRARSRQTA